MTKYFVCLGYKTWQKDLDFSGIDIFIDMIIYFEA